ncbi:MAG TPA: D-2-hydroxyacid dehydrogenase, partial [Firmicutes bacterium]|nr:D-2-hydroxyacid dehydrogenase [Bacillota bacterium]
DYLVIAVPLTAETRCLIGARELELMKTTAILINIARGEVVDESELAAALKQGLIAGAGLDVFETEPLSPDSPLWQLDNCIITPHCAALSPL